MYDEVAGRCRCSIGLLEAAKDLIVTASNEAGAQLWADSLKDARLLHRSLERIQQRLVLKHKYGAVDSRAVVQKEK